jgi:hypothetical protein
MFIGPSSYELHMNGSRNIVKGICGYWSLDTIINKDGQRASDGEKRNAPPAPIGDGEIADR